MEDDVHIKTTKNSDYHSPVAGFFLFISIVLNVLVLAAFIFCQYDEAIVMPMVFIFCVSLALFLFYTVPLSVHANKYGGNKLCRIYAVSSTTCIVSGVALGLVSGLFESELLGCAALVLFMLSYVSGYAVVPFLRRKREFIFYLIAQSLSLVSLFGSAYVAISTAAAAGC